MASYLSNQTMRNMTNKKYKLVIFDCDGTLVDTETLINKAFSSIMVELGYSDFTFSYCLENFTGLSYPAVIKRVKELHPEVNIDTMQQRYIERFMELQPSELQEMPNAGKLIESLKIAKCVASNGEREVVRTSLKAVQLLKYFKEDSIYTYEMVKQGKPAPDLFLHAAKSEGFNPEECIVVEDSIVGVTAAKAANIDVLALHPVNYEHKFNFTDELNKLKPLAIITDLLEVNRFI
jgi:HAD superfamily hydrolase (TIGR01509 family)